MTTVKPAQPREDVTTQHLCDRCGVRAKVQVVVTATQSLFFCGHHGTRYKEHIVQQGYTIRELS